jgi:hypothetical protein
MVSTVQQPVDLLLSTSAQPVRLPQTYISVSAVALSGRQLVRLAQVDVVFPLLDRETAQKVRFWVQFAEMPMSFGVAVVVAGLRVVVE